MSYTAGLYSWAGPGTIRMIRLKYPRQKIDQVQINSSYNEANLMAAKTNLKLSDAWISFSWGFSHQTETEDYQFVAQKLPNFMAAGIRTHAYIQGPNLVIQDNQEADYYCRDYRGRLIPYHRGRKLTCVNNPHFLGYIQRKIETALAQPFDGIFIDNLFFGQMPLRVARKWVTSFGCYCSYCLDKYHKQVGGQPADKFELNSPELAVYQSFRQKSLADFTQKLADLVKSAGKEFGSNSFDPKFTPELFYGHNLTELAQVQDYLLFENHSLPYKNKNNTYLRTIINQIQKPVGIVSYRKGIGREPLYTQADFDTIYTESQRLGYMPIYKGSEFTHQGVWTNYDFTRLRPVQEITNLDLPEALIKELSLPGKRLIRLYNRLYPKLLEWYFENSLVRKLANPAYYRTVA